MLTNQDFSKKQIVVVMCSEGEKMAFGNDNFIVKDKDGKIKFQISCYRLFIVFVIGNTSITTVLIQNARKFGYYIVLMTRGFRMYSIIGAPKEGNTLLHRKQYAFQGLDLAKHIVKNKLSNQQSVLKNVRSKNDDMKNAILMFDQYKEKLEKLNSLQEIMGIEGAASKRYFALHFDNVNWRGRQPRLKRDYINSSLDIGYTLLFSFIDAILECFGFDVYCGIMHTQFYMRKSLVCDMVEPFRCLIDKQIKKSINLKQIREEDFIVSNNQYKLSWKKSSDYVRFLVKPLMDNKDEIFVYIRDYYRAFMKEADTSIFPEFVI